MTPASDEKHSLVTISFGPLKEPIMRVEAEGQFSLVITLIVLTLCSALTLVPLDMIVLTGVVMLYYKKAQQGAGSGALVSKLLCGSFARVEVGASMG